MVKNMTVKNFVANLASTDQFAKVLSATLLISFVEILNLPIFSPALDSNLPNFTVQYS